MNIRETIESGIKSGSITKTQIAAARNKRQEHSTAQFDSFLRKVDDVETCLKNLGFEIMIKRESK